MECQNRVQWVYSSRNNEELAERYDHWAKDYDTDLVLGLSQEDVEKLRENGFQVTLWQELIRLIDLRPDGICTNRPDLLRRLLSEPRNACRGLPIHNSYSCLFAQRLL